MPSLSSPPIEYGTYNLVAGAESANTCAQSREEYPRESLRISLINAEASFNGAFNGLLFPRGARATGK